MKKLEIQSLIALILSAQISLLPAASPVIGIALADGNVTVDNTRTPGNASLFEGNTVETGKVSSRLQLQNGSSVQLASDSRGKVYGNRLILEKGTSRFRTSKGYEIDALSLKIAGIDPSASARVSVHGPVVQVAALTGNVRVANSRGVTIANLAAGRVLDFTPQDQGATGASTLTGCLTKSGSGYVLMDETSGVTMELRGSGLDEHVGHRIQVTGSMMASGTPMMGASQVVNISDVRMLSTGCTMSPAAAGIGAGAGAGVGAAAAGGAMGGSAATAIIAGIVIAAAVGTTVGVIATGSETVSPSRP